MTGETNPAWLQALRKQDQTDLPSDTLAAFKELCSYQLEHNPRETLYPAFRRIMAGESLTYGAASTIAPFMVYPTCE